MLAVIGTIFGAFMGAKKSKELKELEGKIDESKKEKKTCIDKYHWVYWSAQEWEEVQSRDQN